MSDIATHAEVGKGTLYRHFPDKESLLITVIRTRFDDLHAIVSQADEMEDPFHALKTALHATLRAIQSDTGLQLAIMCSSGSHHEDIEEQKTAFGASMIRIVERAQRAARFARTSTLTTSQWSSPESSRPCTGSPTAQAASER